MAAAAPLEGLTASEAKWIAYVRDKVAPRIGARDAAVVTWWALKEGALSDIGFPNPWRHSLCGASQIGPLEICGGGAWQVGMAALQPALFTLSAAEGAAAKLYPGKSIRSLLASIADDANVSSDDAYVIENAGGDLRKAWLLRDPAIGMYLQAPHVERQCVEGETSWCFGGWPNARRFASSNARVREVVDSLERYYASGPGFASVARRALPWIAGGAALYWLMYYTQTGTRLRRKAVKALPW